MLATSTASTAIAQRKSIQTRFTLRLETARSGAALSILQLTNTYFITNNIWNWFVYQGYEVTVSKQSNKVQLFGTYTYSPDHLAGTFQPNDPTAIIEPTKFANNAGLGSVRGNVTNDWTGDTRNRMWQRNQARIGATYRARWGIRLSSTPHGAVGYARRSCHHNADCARHSLCRSVRSSNDDHRRKNSVKPTGDNLPVRL